MRHLTFAVVLLACLPNVSHADETLSPQVIKDIKAATVFVKIKSEDLAGSGSGFVIQAKGDVAYIVTNHHVVEPKVAQIVIVPERRSGGSRYGHSRHRSGTPGFAQPIVPTPMLPGFPSQRPERQDETPRYSARLVVREFKNVDVTAVFRSGTKDEESMSGKLVAVDPDEDLAVVKVSGVKQMPRAIEYRDEPQLSETMPIYVFGFPLGQDLATGKRSPAITVGKGAVSSLRTDDDGNLAVVQLDAALNHGNSGGPVVDARGRLVGVAVARITEEESQNLGLAIPSRAVVRLLQGRPDKAVLTLSQRGDEAMQIHVAAAMIDPLGNVKSAKFYYLNAAKLAGKPKSSDPLDTLPGCHALDLTLENGVASGTISVKKGITAVELLHQLVATGEGGKQAISNSAVEKLALVPPTPVNLRNAAVAGRAPSPNGSIGIHFVGTGKPFYGRGGVVPMNNWNNEQGLAFLGEPVIDNSGANSGATILLEGVASVWATGSSNELLSGYVAGSNFKPMTLTVHGIPYAHYRMYVYVGDSTLGDEARVTVNGATYYYTPEGSGPNTYTAITNTSSETHQLGNYIKIDGLSGANQKIVLAGTTQQYSGLCGVEIVSEAIAGGAGPSSAAPANPASAPSTSPRRGPVVVHPVPRRGPGSSARPGNPFARQADKQEHIFGGRFGPQFRDAAPAKGMLVGFEVGLGKWGANDVVSALRPIYLDEQGKEALGEQHGAFNGQTITIRAKQGYAVGAITAKSLAAIDGFSLTFMKIDKGRLEPADKYESDWTGGKGGVAETTVSGDGSPAIGIVGHTNGNDCTAVGLIFAPADQK